MARKGCDHYDPKTNTCSKGYLARESCGTGRAIRCLSYRVDHVRAGDGVQTQRRRTQQRIERILNYFPFRIKILSNLSQQKALDETSRRV